MEKDNSGRGSKTFWKESGTTRAIVTEAFRIIRDVIRDVVKAISGIMRGWLQVIKGIVQVVSGILTGDFGRVWKGLKNIFGGGVKATLALLRGMTAPVRRIVATIGGAIADVFSSAWGKVTGIFEKGKDAVISVINLIVDAVNAILPGDPLSHVGGGGGGGGGRTYPNVGGNLGKGKTGQGKVHRARGGTITRPMAIVGEEAPQHPEWVIATNPAYKRANIRYWAQAGHDLGIPGFGMGGAIGSAIGKGISSLPITGGTPNAADVRAKLPKPNLPFPFKTLGPWLIERVVNWVKEQFKGPDIKGGGSAKVIAVGRWLQSMGYLVGEHPAFGGVDPVHVAGSYHYRGRAIDVNWPNASTEPRFLDRIFPVLARLDPAELLWRVAHHFDHLHVAFRKGGRLPGWVHGRSTLNPNQLASLAHYVGMNNPALMGQKAMGESGGNPLAVGDGGASIGLWQIHTGYHPEHSKSDLRDPLYNARAALGILNSEGIGAFHAPATGPKGKIFSLVRSGTARGGAARAGVGKAWRPRAKVGARKIAPRGIQGPGLAGHVQAVQVEPEQVNVFAGEGEAEEDPAVKAAEELKAAVEEQTQQMKDLEATIDTANKIGETELAVGLVEAKRALADIISGQLGPRSLHAANTAGAGSVGTY